MIMNRRNFFASATAGAAAVFGKSTPKWDRNRLSAVTDEIATLPGGAIGFAKLYNLKWLELRAVPGGGGEYVQQKPEVLRAAAKEFADNGIGISFLNTGMLKFWLPGTAMKPGRSTPAQIEERKARETKRYEARMQYLENAIRAAQILNVKDIRVFAFSRVDDPQKHFPQIADILGEHALKAEKEGVRLLLENEVSCNVATCEETAKILKMVPSKALGINWDAMNGEDLKEPVSVGYKLLPKDRLWNIQVKGKSLMEEEKKIDWAAVIGWLQRDRYAGHIGLETHMFGRMLFTHSHYCIREMIRIVEGA
jgi:L-ribulose-5-phosphate 3-epimerase